MMKNRSGGFLLTLGLLSVMCYLVDCGCLFEGENHDVGSVWHTKTFGTCVNCTCVPADQGAPEVKCVNTASQCPKITCSSPKKDPNSCCPYCEVSASEDESSANKREACTVSSGRTYNHGDYFSSNETGLRPTTENQCVLCSCQDGQSLCHLKTCPATSCSAYYYREDDCCPVCADCIHNTGGIKKNGSSWHPTIISIGEITCITCTCMNGNITCQTNCIPDHELPCRNPHKSNGECCRTCPDGQSPIGTTRIPQIQKEKKEKKDRKERKGKRRRKDRKKSNRRKGKKDKKKRKNKCDNPDIQKDTKALRRCNRRLRRRKDKKAAATRATLRPVPSQMQGVDLATLCIKKKKTTYLVYKSVSDAEMMIAFDEVHAGKVDVYRWSANTENENKKSVVSYTEPETLEAAEFRRTINNTNVVGTTGSSQYRKFKKRLKDKLEQCRINCDPDMFFSVLQKVKARLLKFGDKC